MYATNWRATRKSLRKAGPVWEVVCRTNTGNRRGFFKYPTQQSIRKAGPSIANEWIADQLARLVRINSAKIEWAEVNGYRGIVSVVHPIKKYLNWIQFHQQSKGRFIQKLIHPERMFDLLVFDMWICNLDRHSGNLIVYPVGKQYDFYLIDHGLCLLGAVAWRGKPWNSPYWSHVTRYNKHYPKGIVQMVTNYQQFEHIIDRIQLITPYQIAQIVESVPENFLSSHEKETVTSILCTRQQNLPSILSVWLKRYKRIQTPPRIVCSPPEIDDYYYYE